MPECKNVEIVFENLDSIKLDPKDINFLDLGGFDLDIDRTGLYGRNDLVKKISFEVNLKARDLENKINPTGRILNQRDISKITFHYDNSFDSIYTNWPGSFIEQKFLQPKREKENPLQINQILNGKIVIIIGEG